MVAMATFLLLWFYLVNSQASVYRTIGPLVLNVRDRIGFISFNCFSDYR